MTDINERYRDEGWGKVTDKSLGISPENVESQARTVASWAHGELERLTALNAELATALEEVCGVIDAAGTLNLSNGVQIGQTAWYVKITYAMNAARAALQKAKQ